MSSRFQADIRVSLLISTADVSGITIICKEYNVVLFNLAYDRGPITIHD